MIKGITITKILSHNDNRGFFREIFKKNKINNKITFKQISHSFIKKKIIKAWHLHKKQTQWNYLIKGKILVYLFDTRKKSTTFKKYITLKIDSENNKIVYSFEPGIAHGYLTLSKENHMLYATSGVYNHKEEYKIPLENNLIPNYFKGEY